MTVLIAIVLHDAVVLASDCRTSTASEIITDEKIKWENAQDDISIGVFGVVKATDKAKAEINLSSKKTAEEWSQEIRDVVIESATHLLEELGPNSNERMQVGLAVAGKDETGYFVAATQFGHGMSKDVSKIERGNIGEVRFIIIGGKDDDRSMDFLKAELDKLDIAKTKRPTSRTFHRQLAQAAAATIRDAASIDPSVSSKSRFTFKRSGQSDFSGYLN